jgi:hypothetical protein
MPYKVRKQGSKYLVVNADTGDVKGTHATKTKAMAQLRALYANVKDAKKKKK